MSVYVWVKAIHIIFVVAWMAGLLIFPRYKLHQSKAEPGGELFETMKDASARLRRIILTPALLIVWGLGITMLVMNQALLTNGWMHVKLLLVLALSGVHGYFISIGRKIDQGDQAVSAKSLKMLNELPFVIMIGVVIMAVVKPF